MVSIRQGMTLLALAMGMMTMAACASYPSEPRYSTRPVPVNPTGVRVVGPNEAPPPARGCATGARPRCCTWRAG